MKRARAIISEEALRHASQILASALPIRYVAAAKGFLQKEQPLEAGLFADELAFEKIRGAQCNRLTFELGGR